MRGHEQTTLDRYVTQGRFRRTYHDGSNMVLGNGYLDPHEEGDSGPLRFGAAGLLMTPPHTSLVMPSGMGGSQQFDMDEGPEAPHTNRAFTFAINTEIYEALGRGDEDRRERLEKTRKDNREGAHPMEMAPYFNVYAAHRGKPVPVIETPEPSRKISPD